MKLKSIKNKAHIRMIGNLGIVVTVISLVLKLMYNANMNVQDRIDMGVLIGLIVGFALMNSAALLELRNRVDSLGRRR